MPFAQNSLCHSKFNNTGRAMVQNSWIKFLAASSGWLSYVKEYLFFVPNSQTKMRKLFSFYCFRVVFSQRACVWRSSWASFSSKAFSMCRRCKNWSLFWIKYMALAFVQWSKNTTVPQSKILTIVPVTSVRIATKINLFCIWVMQFVLTQFWIWYKLYMEPSLIRIF